MSKILAETKLREQNGRDSFSRFRAQVRSAAMAALKILEGGDIDRVYCDLHDDFVIRYKTGVDGEHVFGFYQVKTKGKKNHQWTINEVTGLVEKEKAERDNTKPLAKSFVGKLLRHVVVFDDACREIVFQTNVHASEKLENLINEIHDGRFDTHNARDLLECFNCAIVNEKEGEQRLSYDEIVSALSILRLDTDVEHLKGEGDDFNASAGLAIHKYSEVDLNHVESEEISIKLLRLVESKSSGMIDDVSSEVIENLAGVSINDLLDILSISREAYYQLLDGDNDNAVKAASIMQRMFSQDEYSEELIGYCSRCKTKWDIWRRKRRHNIDEMELQKLILKLRGVLKDNTDVDGTIRFEPLTIKVNQLAAELGANAIFSDISDDIVLGGLFSELIRSRA